MSSSTEVISDFAQSCLVSRIELLQGMNQETVHRFNSLMRRTKCRRGEWVFVHGDPADSIYILQSGRMKITALSEDGHEVVQEILGPGGLFGGSMPIPAARRARTTPPQPLERSRLCEIRRKDFETLLTEYPKLSLWLLKSVGLRLKKAEAQLLNFVCQIGRAHV